MVGGAEVSRFRGVLARRLLRWKGKAYGEEMKFQLTPSTLAPSSSSARILAASAFSASYPGGSWLIVQPSRLLPRSGSRPTSNGPRSQKITGIAWL